MNRIIDTVSRSRASALGVLLASIAIAASAAPAAPELRTLSSSCANCHGTSGQGAGAMPSLAGASKAHLAEQMRLFRDGKRAATVMHQIAKGYSDDEIDALAEHFSRQAAK
jgi:cytochrome subunit of sulfide dehydrogenase